MHLKIINLQAYKKESENVKTCLIENNKETDIKFVLNDRSNEIQNFRVFDIEKITHETFDDLRENIVLSAVDFATGKDNDILIKKSCFFNSLQQCNI